MLPKILGNTLPRSERYMWTMHSTEIAFHCNCFFTDRVRMFVSPHPGGGGTPARSSQPGGYLVGPGRGVPHLGYPPPPVGPGWGGGVPHFGKQMEYLICRGRYASCVHAGGLSCFSNNNYSKILFFRAAVLNVRHFVTRNRCQVNRTYLSLHRGTIRGQPYSARFH